MYVYAPILLQDFFKHNIIHMNRTIQVWLPHMRLLSKTNLAWNDTIYYFEKEVK